jgi:3-methyl-2-oxobutanoate hydroxymethyltransferase
MILLECIDKNIAREITKNLKIPTIGIGSSVHCDGQILVINDILNTDNTIKKPKFVKTYTNLTSSINKAIKKYVADVKNRKFPK